MIRQSACILIFIGLTAAACSRSEPESPAGQGSDQSAAGAHASEGPATISLKIAEAAGVKTEIAGPATLTETLPLYGRIVPDPERQREVSARFPGVIRAVHKKPGDAVRQGETLATVESDESLQTYAITAPLAGIVTSRDANPGEDSGTHTLFVITDPSSVVAELSVFPRERARIRAGQPVHIRAADGGFEADARLTRVDMLGGANQSVTARAALENAEARWTPGLYVVADVVIGQSPAAVAIPRSAVQYVENRETAFVLTPAGYVPRVLKLGRKDPEHVEVLDGVAAGERVAHVNTYLLASELAKPEPEE